MSRRRKRIVWLAKKSVAVWCKLTIRYGPVFMGNPGELLELEPYLIRRGKVRNVYTLPPQPEERR